MATIFRRFKPTAGGAASPDMGPMSNQSSVDEIRAINILSTPSKGSKATADSQAAGAKRGWLPSWFSKRKKGRGSLDSQEKVTLLTAAETSICPMCNKESASTFNFCGFCGSSKLRPGSSEGEHPTKIPGEVYSPTHSPKNVSINVEPHSEYTLNPPEDTQDHEEDKDLSRVSVDKPEKANPEPPEAKLETRKRKMRISIISSKVLPETAFRHELEALLIGKDAEDANTIKAFVAEVLAVPSIVDLKQEFMDKLMEGKESTLPVRNQAQKDVWRLHDTLLIEAWDTAMRLMDEKFDELETRELQVKESAEKSERLKAACLKEMTVLRDRNLPREFKTPLIAPLPFLTETTQQLVKNCTEETLRLAIDDALRGEDGKVFDMIRHAAKKEHKHLDDLLTQCKQELEIELPRLRLEEERLRADLQEAQTQLLGLQHAHGELQEQHNSMAKKLHVQEVHLAMAMTEGFAPQPPPPATSPTGKRPAPPVSNPAPLVDASPGPSTPSAGVRFLGLPRILAPPPDEHVGAANAEADSNEAATQLLEDLSYGQHQEEEAGAFMPLELLDYLHRIGAVVDFSTREAVFKTINAGQTVKLGESMVINMAEDFHDQMDGSADATHGADKSKPSPEDSFRECSKKSWMSTISHILNSTTDGESRPILPGAPASALMNHATEVRAQIDKHFGSRGMDLLFALKRLGEQLDIEVLEDAEKWCQQAKQQSSPFTVLLIERINSARSEVMVLTKLCVALVQSLVDLSDKAGVISPAAQKVKVLSYSITEALTVNQPHLISCYDLAKEAFAHLDEKREDLKYARENLKHAATDPSLTVNSARSSGQCEFRGASCEIRSASFASSRPSELSPDWHSEAGSAIDADTRNSVRNEGEKDIRAVRNQGRKRTIDSEEHSKQTIATKTLDPIPAHQDTTFDQVIRTQPSTLVAPGSVGSPTKPRSLPGSMVQSTSRASSSHAAGSRPEKAVPRSQPGSIMAERGVARNTSANLSHALDAPMADSLISGTSLLNAGVSNGGNTVCQTPSPTGSVVGISNAVAHHTSLTQRHDHVCHKGSLPKAAPVNNHKKASSGVKPKAPAVHMPPLSAVHPQKVEHQKEEQTRPSLMPVAKNLSLGH